MRIRAGSGLQVLSSGCILVVTRVENSTHDTSKLFPVEKSQTKRHYIMYIPWFIVGKLADSPIRDILYGLLRPAIVMVYTA